MKLYQEANITCGYRLVVRTSGFHPGNRSSILRSRANTNLIKRTLSLVNKVSSKKFFFISRSREVASRKAHNLEVVRSIRTSATN